MQTKPVSPKSLIGSNLFVDVLNYKNIPAKVDTGADSSAIWASSIKVTKDHILKFKLFAPEYPFYTGKIIKRKDFSVIRVKSSNGQSEHRYRTTLSLRLNGRRIRVLFNLSDRSKNNFPILIGRRTLRNKFIVDVSTSAIKTSLQPAAKLKSHQPGQTYHEVYSKQKKGEIL